MVIFVSLQEIGAQNREVDTQKDKIKRLETQLKEARGTMEKQVAAMDTLFGKTQKLAEDLDTQIKCRQTILITIFGWYFLDATHSYNFSTIIG